MPEKVWENTPYKNKIFGKIVINKCCDHSVFNPVEQSDKGQ